MIPSIILKKRKKKKKKKKKKEKKKRKYSGELPETRLQPCRPPGEASNSTPPERLGRAGPVLTQPLESNG
ncbi:hypothetical protein VN97_g1012 [Penicillium thymicola]|uniref:Uncharacterized protein n=1 Tax=Penicillium thymicola TaxID=293382 RepID=A0AAI9TSK3_PENTH|nr:hypothetical protein VN97_g1012 [Penicillium thymicola]